MANLSTPVRFKVDMDKLDAVLEEQPRFSVSSTFGGKEFSIIEAVRMRNPGDLAADNQVNVLC